MCSTHITFSEKYLWAIDALFYLSLLLVSGIFYWEMHNIGSTILASGFVGFFLAVIRSVALELEHSVAEIIETIKRISSALDR